MERGWNGVGGGIRCDFSGFGGRGGAVPSEVDGIVMEWAGFRPAVRGAEMKKPSKIEGLGERETGFEPATFSLGSSPKTVMACGKSLKSGIFSTSRCRFPSRLVACRRVHSDGPQRKLLALSRRLGHAAPRSILTGHWRLIPPLGSNQFAVDSKRTVWEMRTKPCHSILCVGRTCPAR